MKRRECPITMKLWLQTRVCRLILEFPDSQPERDIKPTQTVCLINVYTILWYSGMVVWLPIVIVNLFFQEQSILFRIFLANVLKSGGLEFIFFKCLF